MATATQDKIDTMIEFITVNRTGAVKRLHLNGREHYVVPVSMITPGVLNGSKGALFYPPEELRKSVDSWNGMPIVVYHPTQNGHPVSARRADVLNSQGVGVVLNARINKNGKLVADGWFDIERVEKVDKRVLQKLEAGDAFELSTGLFTDNYPAENGANYNGKGYTHIAKNHRPDHLAVFVDQKGACSLKDGCGVNVHNSAGTFDISKKMPWEEETEEPTDNKCATAQHLARKRRKRKSLKFISQYSTNLSPQQVIAKHQGATLNELSLSDLHPELEKALRGRFGNGYLVEVFPDTHRVIFSQNDRKWSIVYSVDKKTDRIKIDGMPIEVRRKVTYLPVHEPVSNTEKARTVLNRLDPVSTALQIIRNNCGIGSGGFQPGNKCAKGGSGGGGSKKSTPKKASKSSKLTIADTHKALASKGYKLGRAKTDLKKKMTSYEVTDSKGKKKMMTTDEIKKLIGD